MTEEVPPAAEFDMEFVPELPGGRAIMPAEIEGRFVWLVAEGEMTEKCRSEFVEYLRFIVGEGLWTQNWAGQPLDPPSHLRRAS